MLVNYYYLLFTLTWHPEDLKKKKKLQFNRNRCYSSHSKLCVLAFFDSLFVVWFTELNSVKTNFGVNSPKMYKNESREKKELKKIKRKNIRKRKERSKKKDCKNY